MESSVRGMSYKSMRSEEKLFAKAAVYLNATEIATVAGHSSADVATLLGRGHKTMIFRPEDMVLLDHGQ